MIRIRELREARGLQQKELAIDLGVTQPTISGWELGIKVPSARNTQRLADYFGVSVDYLLGRNGEEKRAHPVIEDGPSYPPEYDLLSPEDRELVDNMIRRLIQEKNQADTSSPSNGAGSETA